MSTRSILPARTARALPAPLLVLLAILALPLAATAQWTADPSIDVPVCTASGGQSGTLAVPDGSGGAVVVWLDYRSGPARLFAQRLDAFGVPQWATDGIAVADSSAPFEADLAPDGAGGAYVVWVDTHDGTSHVWAQHLQADGTEAWGHGGVEVCTASTEERSPAVLADGAGGAFVAWHDYRFGSKYLVYAQRLDAAGGTQWGGGGRLLSLTTDWSIDPQIVPDGAGGLIVTWHAGDLKMARLDPASGSNLWTGGGEIAAETVGSSVYWEAAPDGAGGAIVAFLKDSHVYASRVDSSGTRAWPTDVPVGLAASSFPVRVMQDGAGGAYVCWRDTRNALAGDAWAQRLDADGTPLWTTNGVAVSDGWTSTSGPSVCEDGSGGLLVGWHGDVGLRAQRVGPDGTLAWATNGVLVSSAWLTYFDLELVADGNGGAIAAARTNPAQGSSDIHAEHVDAGGNLGGAVAAPWVEAAGPGARVSAYPNPFRGTITLEIDASRSAAAVSATVFDAAGRRVRSLVAPADGGVARVRWDGRDASGRPVPAGVYFVRAADGGATGRVVHLR